MIYQVEPYYRIMNLYYIVLLKKEKRKKERRDVRMYRAQYFR